MFGSGKSDALFYEAFERHASAIVRAAKLLHESFEDVSRAGPLASQISDAEHEGDKITHETIARLHKTWITPLDRADIHGLITALDDVLDLTEAVSERIVAFEIVRVPRDAVELAAVLIKACEAVERAIKLLRDLKRSAGILELCIEINRLENEADGIYRHALADMYSGKPHAGTADEKSYRDGGEKNDPLVVLKWRDIFDNLEAATDRCEDVANILEGVVLEYA
jgi:hypothetical protein